MSRKPPKPPKGPDDDEVGRGRPPKATRFPKGVSGNPSGKSGRASQPKPLEKVFGRGIPMIIDGKRRLVPIAEFTRAHLLQLANQKNLGALKELNRMSERLEAARALEEPPDRAGPVQFNINYAPNRMIHAVKLLGIAHSEREDGRTTLELWAVQEGIRRLRRPLTDEERRTLAQACPEFEAWYSTLGK